MVVGSNLRLLGGQWWCSAWSVGSNLTFGGQWWCSVWSVGSNLTFGGSMVV
jgi:hypothetical protein